MAKLVNPSRIAIRSLYRDQASGKIYRVVFTGGGQDHTYLFDIEARSLDFSKWPTDEFAEMSCPSGSARASFLRVKDDPYDPAKVTLKQTPAHMFQTHENWLRIQDIVEIQNVSRLLKKSTRTVVIKEQCDKVKASRWTLHRLLVRYFKHGMTPSAVCSHFPNCGSAGSTGVWRSQLTGRAKKRTYSRPPGRVPREYKVRYLPPSEMLDRLLDQFIDIYENRKHTPELVERLVKRAAKSIETEPLDKSGNRSTENPRRFRRNLDGRRRKRKRASLTEAMVVDELNALLNKARTVDPDGVDEKPGKTIPLHVTVRRFSYRRRARRPSFAHQGSIGIYSEVAGALTSGRARLQVRGPGERFLIDATVADIYLVHAIDRHVSMGRPTIYFIVDLFSAMIAGLFIGFLPPSRAAAALALENMVTPKEEFCARYGFHITAAEWPCRHACWTLHTDRGTEYMSIEPWPRVTKELLIKLDHSPPREPIWRSVIERRFGIVPGTYNAHCAGVVEQDFGERTAPYYPWDAAMTLDEFTHAVLSGIHSYHRTPISGLWPPADLIFSGGAGTPLELWNYGVEHGSGTLRELSVEQVVRATSLHEDASVTGQGLHTKDGVFYTSPNIEAELKFLARKRSHSVQILRHPDHLQKVYFDNRGFLEEATLSRVNDFSLDGVTRPELKAYLELRSRNVAQAEIDNASLRQAHAERVRHTAINARKKTKSAVAAAGLKHPLSLAEALRRKTDVVAKAERDDNGVIPATTTTSSRKDTRTKNKQSRSAKQKFDDAGLDVLGD